MKRWVTVLISLAILAAASVVTLLIFSTEPSAQQEGATKETAMLVEVVAAERGDYRPVIAAMGTVEPQREITLSPRVRGEVIERSDSFTPGGVVRKGETLLRLDPSDYESTIDRRRSALAQAESALTLELGRAEVAKEDFELMGESLPDERRDLVLRRPQLRAAEAQVAAARANLRQAELDLERTTIVAPFDAQVISRSANLGSQVGPGDALGRLVGRERYWVATAVPLSKLRWIDFESGPNGRPARARVRNRAAWPEGIYREGSVFKLVGTLEESTRMARVLIEVPNPLGDGSMNSDQPTLMLGAFVEVLIDARPLADVVRLSRNYLRQDDRAWVMDQDGRLRIRTLDIIFRDEGSVYVRSGLEDGDRVVTTNLSTPTDGAALRVEGGSESGGEEAE